MLQPSSIFRRIVMSVGSCTLLAIVGISSVSAIQNDDSSALAQSFQTADKLEIGMLVGLQRNSPNTVEASNTDRVSQLVGIVADKPLVEFSGKGTTTSVVTSGVTQALVSDINGTVKTGDKITASPIKGVGMKATDSALVVGTAQDNLKDVTTTNHTLTDKEGKARIVHIGRVPVQVNVTYYSATNGAQSFIPAIFQDAANALAGKAVSPIRVLASLLIAILALVSVTILLYSSVRSSLISIGRNPLSEKAIHKGLIEVGAIIIGIVLLAFVTIYLILSLS